MYQKQEYLLNSRLLKDQLYMHFQTHKAIVAGGAVRAVFANETISDYDVYFRTQDSLNAFIAGLPNFGFVGVFTTQVAQSFKREQDDVKIQVILMPEMIGLTPKEIINRFDFTVTMGAYDYEERIFVLGDTFLEHLAQRELFINPNGKYPIATLFRLRKYIRKGYTISGVEAVKLALCINNLHITTYRELREQLEGIDTAFLKSLTDRLIDPNMAEKKYDYQEFLNLVNSFYEEKLDDMWDE